MKKIISTIAVVLLTLSISLLVFGMTGKINRNRQIAEKIKSLPLFSFMTLDGSSFSSSGIKSGPLLLMRFHPECEHCRYEISEILKSRIMKSVSRVIMISSADTVTIKSLFLQYDLSFYPGLSILVDTSYSFGDIFGNDFVPSIYIYNKELKLEKVIYGEVKTEAIMKYFHDGE